MTVVDVQANLDVIWILIAAAFVMLMQAGFTALESGVTRAKNSINVAMKNITDFTASILIFFLIGYGLMFGDDSGGIIGTSGFSLSGLDKPSDYASFVFQATFAGTAATIISGAVAERMRFSAYVLVSIIVVALVYPVSGHWIWGSGGWLAEKQMVDFAGSTVVHSLGAWIGLAGAVVLGPRIGRFDKDGKPKIIQGHSLVLAVVGVLILWFGWFGFNGGSTLSGDTSVALIIANTMLSAAAGGISCFLVSMLMSKGEVQIEKLLNGVVGGLVAVTAGCAVLTPQGALWLGFFAGIIVYYTEEVILHVLKLDDPVNVVAAHGIAGAWGTLALAFFAPAESLPLKDSWAQFSVQAQGVFSVMAWGLTAGFILFYLLKSLGFLRVPPDAEKLGLNIYEHGATSGLMDTMQTMQGIVAAHRGEGESDLTQRIDVEIGTESGDVAHLFNDLIASFHDTIKQIKNGTIEINNAAALMNKNASEMSHDATNQNDNITEVSHAIGEMVSTISHIAENTTETARSSQLAASNINEVKDLMRNVFGSINSLSNKVDDSYQVVDELNQQSQNITTILASIKDISEQTNLLALNAAIEAARAGDAGRGFAVVADEVRNLSKKTQLSTTEIERVLAHLQAGSSSAAEAMKASKLEVDNTVKITQEAETSLINASKIVHEIERMTDEIATATEEQNSASEEIKNNIGNLENITKNAAARTAGVNDSSNILTSLAKKLNHVVGGLKVSSDDKAA